MQHPSVDATRSTLTNSFFAGQLIWGFQWNKRAGSKFLPSFDYIAVHQQQQLDGLKHSSWVMSTMPF